MSSANRIMGLVAVGIFVLACLAPTLGNRLLNPAEKLGAYLAERKLLAICLIALAALLVRVSLLAVLPVPVPEVGDEFSYLLAADTFDHGRLTNAPHPMWLYLDTFSVNQHPTYMSKYPPAQGAVLAIGQLLGHPWMGVLLSVACMCASILWALQGWLPPRWALVGGVLVLLRLGISSYWINSYWGGAAAAIGGALVIGALPRILRFYRPRDAVFLGIGTAILANSRPFEGLIFCIPVYAVIAIWLCGHRSPSWGLTVPRVIVPVSVILVLVAIFIGYYNWRGTGHSLLFPYTLYSRTYISNPELVWEKGRPPLHYLNPQFEAFFSGWCRDTAMRGKATSIPRGLAVISSDAKEYISFFLWPGLCIPLLAIPWMLEDRQVRFLTVQFAFCFGGFVLVVWFQPHYAAPLTATAFALVAYGMRRIRSLRYKERLVGIGLSRAVVLTALAFALSHRFYIDPHPGLRGRAAIAKQLEASPEDDLVIVRYSSHHDVLQEWVFNGADIDGSKIVWARDIPGVSVQPLLDYFRGRHVWVVDADSPDPRLLPYVAPIDP